MSSLPPPPPPPSSPPSDSAARYTETIGPVPGDPRRWGLGDFALGILASFVVASVVFAAVVLSTGHDDAEDLPLWLFSLSNSSLHATLAAVSVWAAVTKGRGPVRDFRISFKPRDIGTGVLSGILAQVILVPVVTVPVLWVFDQDFDDVSESARSLSDRATSPVGVIMLLFTVCIVAPVVEEVFYRGLALEGYKKRRNLPWLGARTASRKWNIWVAVIFTSAIFSATHFQPILLPALFAVGVLFAVLAQRAGRLGPAIWAHAAFNTTAVVSLLLLEDDTALGLLSM